MQRDSSTQVTTSVSDGLIRVEINTRYGPVSFSYSPEAVEAGLSELVSDVLDKLGESDRSLLARLSKENDLPPERIKTSFDLYRQRLNAKFPNDAIEKFTPGNRTHVQGTVEQFADGIAPGIALMLDHLAVTCLSENLPDVDRDWRRKVMKSSSELRDILVSHFRRAIHALWERRSGNQ
jgi:hypothetical protein